MDLKIDLTYSQIDKQKIDGEFEKVTEIIDNLWSGKVPYTGWVKQPLSIDKQELENILNTAVHIQSRCEEMIVIGVGGSCLGAKAGIQALVGRDEVYDTGMATDMLPKVKFTGTNLSATELTDYIKDIVEKEVILCVVSKSGETVETQVAFEVLKEALLDKYGEEEGGKRIYVLTDAQNGRLRREADEKGYASFAIPSDTGGRYSVLTVAGLLPMAVAGIDIKTMLAGAELMASSPVWDSTGTYYGICRYLLWKEGRIIEIFEYYEPQLEAFAEWIKQLFGESEGKEGKGLYPDSLKLSTDLHSIGQFLQQGTQMFFETVLGVEKPPRDLIVPGNADPLVAGKSLNQLNKAAMEGVIKAHSNGGIPVVKIEIPEIDAFCMGQLYYFFEMTCGITASLMEVNPFDQPGVEMYKSECRKLFERIARY